MIKEIIAKIFKWCKEHIILFTLLSVIGIVVFGYVNIQILHATSEPEFCHLCHPAKGFGPLAEVDSWEHSAHGESGVSCLDCHGRPGVFGYVKAKMGGLKDTYMQLTISQEEKLEILSNPDENLVPSWHCLFCHSDEGNLQVRSNTAGPMKLVEMRMLDDVVNPSFRERKGLADIMQETFVGGTHFDHSMHIENFELSCRDCHFGVVHNPATSTERMNFCLACHAEMSEDAPSVKDCGVCHEAQLAMNNGAGVEGVEDTPSLMYGDAAGIACTDCHTGVTTGVYRPSSATCTACHSKDYVEVFDDWAASTKAKIEKLQALRIEVEAALVDADELNRNTEESWKLYEDALHKLKFVRHDGTNGVHNNEYASAILDKADEGFRQAQKKLDEL